MELSTYKCVIPIAGNKQHPMPLKSRYSSRRSPPCGRTNSAASSLCSASPGESPRSSCSSGSASASISTRNSVSRTIGTDAFAIYFGGKTGAQAGGSAPGRDIRLTVGDAIAIQELRHPRKDRQPGTAPYRHRSQSVERLQPSRTRSLAGHQRFRSLEGQAGRLMSGPGRGRLEFVIRAAKGKFCE